MAATSIGIMHSGTAGKHDDHIAALVAGITSVGLTEHSDFKIGAERYADDDPKVLAKIASDLDSDTSIKVIVAGGGTASALAAQKQTGPTSGGGSGSGKPVVFTSVSAWPTDVANMTGIIARTTELDPDRLEKLSQLLPNKTSFGVLLNKIRHDHDPQKTALTRKAADLHLQKPDFQDIDPTNTATDTETQINTVFANWKKSNIAGVLVAADPLFTNHRAGKTGVISAAATNNLPTIYQWSEFVDDGGLISYGPDLSMGYFLAGTYVGQIVKSPQPATLNPVSLQNMEMVINLATAENLTGFANVPMGLLASTDRIITASGRHIP